MRSTFDTSQHSRVLVLDMQPIEPAVGGGRLRLLGLYHGLGVHLPTLYVGTYDWPGMPKREHRLSSTLVEVDIPLSDAHFAAVEELKQEVGGKTIIDSTFPRFAHYSSEYVDRVRQEAPRADIIIFSHPWIFPLVEDLLRPSEQLIVYDSHNVEGYLRAMLLDDHDGPGAGIVKGVVEVEKRLCEQAQLILACSQEDRQLFHDLYGTDLRKIRLVPNGTFTRRRTRRGRRMSKEELGLSNGPLAVFVGSAYPPNIEAANFILNKLAPELPEVTFAICGGVGEALDLQRIRDNGLVNVVVTGLLSEEAKDDYLHAADLAVNPMFSGSGTNIKMLDFFAVPLPVVSTAVGARGLVRTADPVMRIVEGDQLAGQIRHLLQDSASREKLKAQARQVVQKHYSWECISKQLGWLVTRRLSKLGQQPPMFSVVIPTYLRQQRLAPLMALLAKQKFQYFEVVIVDQSPEPWTGSENDRDLDLLYVHLETPDVVHARNKGAELAWGDVLVFLDDDCEPEIEWLENARRAFLTRDIVGIEGLIRSSRLSDPEYRPVTNEGFEGVGYMTANLFLRMDVFNSLNGFDYAFSPTPFREDTDLGWRALAYGELPFLRDVAVYHPPHRRETDRESHAARSRFFAKDPLLMVKHPARYRQLFLLEDHWQKTPGFWKHFFEGAQRYGIEIPRYYLWRFGEFSRRNLSQEHGVSLGGAVQRRQRGEEQRVTRQRLLEGAS